MTRARHRIQRTSRVGPYVVIAVVVVLAFVLVVTSTHANSSSAPTTTFSVKVGANARSFGFYLDVGASSSLGTQPIPGRTEGYSNDLVRLEAARGVGLTLKEVGCPGETSQSVLLRGPVARIRLMQSRCYRGGPGQLAQARAFLTQQRNNMGVVTIDIGFNDIRPCINSSAIDQSCFTSGLDQVRANLPVLIGELRRSSGPKVVFVGLLYADPFVADYLTGSAAARARAALTQHDMSELNTVLAAAYRAQGVAVANIPEVYHSGDLTPTSLKPYGDIPTDVKYACLYTWICTSAHDDHANALGYAAEAGVIMKALPATLP